MEKAATFSLDIFHWSGRLLLWEKYHLKLETSKGTQSGLKLCSKREAGPGLSYALIVWVMKTQVWDVAIYDPQFTRESYVSSGSL